MIILIIKIFDFPFIELQFINNINDKKILNEFSKKINFKNIFNK